MPKIYTIGYSGKTKDQFIEILDAVGVSIIVDIRLWRVSRFVPWASGANLSNILDRRYKYMPQFAPTEELLVGYKNGQISWAGYERIFNQILADRKVEKLFASDLSFIKDNVNPVPLDRVCFLCSERTADKCHRRLVAEYLVRHFRDISIVHL